jgi:hypothetical protein
MGTRFGKQKPVFLLSLAAQSRVEGGGRVLYLHSPLSASRNTWQVSTFGKFGIRNASVFGSTWKCSFFLNR